MLAEKREAEARLWISGLEAVQIVIDHRKRMEKQLQRRAKELGYELKKIETPSAETPAAV